MQRVSIEYSPEASHFIKQNSYRTSGSSLIKNVKYDCRSYRRTIVLHWSPDLEPALYELPSSSDAATRMHATIETMNSGMDLIETDADVVHALVAAVLEGNNNNTMRTIPSKDERAKYGSSADVLITIASSGMKGFIAEELNRNFAERTQEEVKTPNGEIFLPNAPARQLCGIKRSKTGICPVPGNDCDRAHQRQGCERCYDRILGTMVGVRHIHERYRKASCIQPTV